MTTAINTIKQLPETKEQQKLFAAQIIDHIAQGYDDILETELLLKSFENVIKEVRSNTMYKEILSDDIDSRAEKTFRHNSAIITKVNRTSYDYKDDSKWSGLKRQLKSREELLKSINPDNIVYDPDSGEMLQGPVKKQTSTIAIKFE